jgi:predicted hotdog family 3-hydroxylacyl-ACP dehydratase
MSAPSLAARPVISRPEIRCATKDACLRLRGSNMQAQALAAHCALVGAGTDLRADHGVLAGVRAVALRVDRLDDIDEALDVRAERLIADGPRLLYSFVIQAGGRELLSGRVAVVLRKEESG